MKSPECPECLRPLIRVSGGWRCLLLHGDTAPATPSDEELERIEREAWEAATTEDDPEPARRRALYVLGKSQAEARVRELTGKLEASEADRRDMQREHGEHVTARLLAEERLTAEQTAHATCHETCSGLQGRLNETVERLASTLKLALPRGVDPVQAIELDIKRLLDTEKRWVEACDLARAHCPAGDGESHIRQGIPRLAAKLREVEAERDAYKRRLHWLQRDADANGRKWECDYNSLKADLEASRTLAADGGVARELLVRAEALLRGDYSTAARVFLADELRAALPPPTEET